MEPNLLLISLTAMLAVFVILTLLALTMRVLVAVFPERATSDDAAVLAAVSAAATAAFPGTRVTNVTEVR